MKYRSFGGSVMRRNKCGSCGIAFRVSMPCELPGGTQERKYCSWPCAVDARRTSPAAFWRQVKKTPGCWLWTGHVLNSGYGEIGRKPRTLVHRYSYALAFGEIPKGKLVCHRCDTPLCVRPEHLFLGTDADNHRDMVAKRRHAWGERAKEPKLTAAQVREIRAAYWCRGRKSNIEELSAKYPQVTKGALYCAASGRSWKSL